jgi:ABC-2 type transport system ATP-binding protein
LTEPPPVQAHGLTRYYGRTVGVEDLDLEVSRGEVFGFLGPNGSGKTTTIRLLLGLLHPTGGEARLYGSPPVHPAVRSRVGYLPGELVLDPRMSGLATLRFLEHLDRSRSGPETAGHRVDLCERLGLSHADLRRRTREYSRGMKQKLGLVAAFQHDPDLLILDEPTTGLDPLVRETVFELLAEASGRGATIFHSSHVLSEVDRTCTRVGVLRQGRLVALMKVEEVRRATRRRMVVHFEGPVPTEALRLDGVELAEVEGSRVVLTVVGQPPGLLEALSRHQVRHLVFPEPGLEEAFAAYYEGSAENGSESPGRGPGEETA